MPLAVVIEGALCSSKGPDSLLLLLSLSFFIFNLDGRFMPDTFHSPVLGGCGLAGRDKAGITPFHMRLIFLFIL
jgi:hypothetical protein